MRKRSKRSRGFTLIELGIVIAVIAVLAIVVLAGTGFMESGRLGKASDFVGKLQDAISTLSGRRGGTLQGIGNCPQALIQRQLVPNNFNTPSQVIPNWTFTCAIVNATTYSITVTAEDQFQAQDMANMNLTNPTCTVVAAGVNINFSPCNL